MRECPHCRKGHWHELVEYATRCHGVTSMGVGLPVCPECGVRNPEMVETDRYLQCETCGYVEQMHRQLDLS